MKKISAYNIVKESRIFLMGIAIIWIVFFHSKINSHSEILYFIKRIGYGGVDIFLFISGFGIAHSLKKNTTAQFFKNRLKKILPVFYSFFIINLVYRYISNEKILLTEIAGWIAVNGYWAQLSKQASWYIYAIMIFYAISPLLYSILEETKNHKRTIIVIITVMIIGSIAFHTNNHLMAISRLPIYILGMYAGIHWDKTKTMGLKSWLTVFVTFFIGIVGLYYFLGNYSRAQLRDYGYYWYPFILVAPTFILGTGYILNSIKNIKLFKPIMKTIELCGKASLEILVTHVLLFDIVKTYKIIPSNTVYSNWYWLLCIAVSITIGIIYNVIIEFIKRKTNKKDDIEKEINQKTSEKVKLSV